MRLNFSKQTTRISCYLERVATGIDTSIGANIIRWILWPLSMLYCGGLRIYLWLYKTGKRKQVHLDIPVISIGNLTFGGTGKTPVVIAVCKMLQSAGYKPVVLSRGHGGSSRRGLIVSNGKDILCNSSKCGDEPIVLARNLPGIPVIVGRDRRHTGKLASELFDPSIIVMDDGMQYWQLHRDLDIVVMNSQKPFGSNFVMPAGDLREPVSGIKRAGLVLINCETEITKEQLADITKKVHSINKDLPVYKCSKSATGFMDANTGELFAADWARHRKVVAFCGIGNPESFEHTLMDTGAEVQALIAFRDHQRFGKEDIERIVAEKEEKYAEAIITTEKDASRILPEEMPENLYVLNIELEIEDIVSFEEHITNRIHKQNKETPAEETPDQTTG